MKKLTIVLCVSTLLALAACSAPKPSDTTSEADEFAARINGSGPAPAASQTPTVAPPRKNAAAGAYTPGTATDPQSATCNANAMGPFIGRVADEATRLDVMSAAAGASDVRFIEPGSTYISPDPSNPRLNLMLDQQGVIRDARCG